MRSLSRSQMRAEAQNSFSGKVGFSRLFLFWGQFFKTGPIHRIIFNTGVLATIGCFMFIFSANYGEMDSLCEKKLAGNKKFAFIGLLAPALLAAEAAAILAFSSRSFVLRLTYAAVLAFIMFAAALYAMYTGSAKGFLEAQNKHMSEIRDKESKMRVSFSGRWVPTAAREIPEITSN